MWPLLATIVLLAAHTAAKALPQAPSRTATEEELDNAAVPVENFDPSLGNRYHNISCVGSHYSLELPLQNGWNPNERSMQELCAKPQYNGGPRGQHVGGWCDHGEVVFDPTDDAEINTELANPRVLLGCRYRCFCNNNIPVENRNIQPKPSENQNSLKLLHEDRSSSLTYEVRLDIAQDFTMSRDYNKGTLGDEEVDVLRLTRSPEIRHPESLAPPHYDYTSLDDGNKILCTGSLPTFVLPPPYSVLPPSPDFLTNQQLCATQLNGGLLGANAGGYCHRSNSLDPTSSFPSNTVWFSDEMTPRLDWTWDGGLFFAAASIRLHCYLNCACRSGHTDKSPTANVWRFVNGHQLTLRGNGRVDLESSLGSSRPGSGDTQLTTDSSGSGEPDPKRIKYTPLECVASPGECENVTAPAHNASAGLPGSSSGDDLLRPQAWPTELLGPVPSAPPNATELVGQGSGVGSGSGKGEKKTGVDLTMCGSRCEGVKDCGGEGEGNGTGTGTGTDHTCVCAYPNANDAKWLGLDPVMPVSVCLALMNVAFGSASRKMVAAGGLNGRDVEDRGQPEGLYLRNDGEEWMCRCNATFTHNRCCGSRDGMVWLGGDS